MKRTILAIVLLAACYHGPTLAKFKPAHSPAGIAADIRIDDTRLRGELLEAQDTALVLLTDSGRLVLIPYRDISYGGFQDVGYLVVGGDAPKESIARMRSLSRFPTGMTPRIRAELLAAFGQTAFQVVP